MTPLASVVTAVLTEKIDAPVEREIKTRRLVGASLAIIRSGTMVHTQGYGFADLDAVTRTTAQTRDYLASITKMFIPTALMLLLEDDRPHLDQAIGDILNGLPEVWRTMAIRQLPDHTSGTQGFIEFEVSFPCAMKKQVRD